jgi:DNA mismatch repair protein MutL
VDGFVPSGEAALHEVLDMMACKAAVKAGDRLSDDEISMLLEQRHKVERSSNCPHGRPTSVRLGLAQLERLFERR